MQGEIEQAAYAYAKAVDDDEKIVVGVNRFVDDESAADRGLPARPRAASGADRAARRRPGRARPGRRSTRRSADVAAAAAGHPEPSRARCAMALGSDGDARRGLRRAPRESSASTSPGLSPLAAGAEQPAPDRCRASRSPAKLRGRWPTSMAGPGHARCAPSSDAPRPPTASTHAAANSGWWLTAPPVSIPISGWIVGTASDTLAMSVESVGGGAPASSAAKRRPERLGVAPVGAERAPGPTPCASRPAPARSIVERGARRQRARLEAALDPRSQHARGRSRRARAHMNRPVGVAGMMLAASPPFGDDAVDLVARLQLLAQQPDRHLGDRERVRGVHALATARRRVRLAAGVADVEVVDGEAGGLEPVARARGGPSSPRGPRRRRPRSSIRILPPPPSSAGVPSTITVEPDLVGDRGECRAPAPTAAAAIMLCPQAWPTPGSASYSAQTTMRSGPCPARPTNAVGEVAVAGASTLEARRSSERRRPAPAAWCSSKQQLGVGVDVVAEIDQRVRLSATQLASARVLAARPRSEWPAHSITATTSPAPDRVAGCDPDLGDRAGLLGGDGVLHLHGLEDADGLADLDGVAHGDEHLHDRALHRHGDRARTRSPVTPRAPCGAGAAAPAGCRRRRRPPARAPTASPGSAGRRPRR